MENEEIKQNSENKNMQSAGLKDEGINNDTKNTIQREHLSNSQEHGASTDERTYESNTQCEELSKSTIQKTLIENNTNKDTEQLQCKFDANKTINDKSGQGVTKSNNFIYKISAHDENTKYTSQEVTKLYGSHNELEVMDNDNELDGVQPSYMKDEDGYKARDMFGRDSSSDDEDYEDYNDQRQSDNEFVHISEIDFSMFP